MTQETSVFGERRDQYPSWVDGPAWLPNASEGTPSLAGRVESDTGSASDDPLGQVLRVRLDQLVAQSDDLLGREGGGRGGIE